MERLKKRLEDAGLRAPFPAYVRQNFAALTEVIGSYGAHWDEIAAWAVEEGYAKKGLKGEAARKAYERERKRREAKSAESPPVSSDRPSVRILPVASLQPPPTKPVDPPALTSPEVEERIADLRKSMTGDWEKKGR